MSTAAPFARFVTDYPGLIDVVGERTEQMEIARLELDRIAGLSSGHSGKLFSKAPRKNLGIISLGPVLQTLGLVLCVLEDPATRRWRPAKNSTHPIGGSITNAIHPENQRRKSKARPAREWKPRRPAGPSRFHARISGWSKSGRRHDPKIAAAMTSSRSAGRRRDITLSNRIESEAG